MLTLKILFWSTLLIVFYTYLGYGILLYIIIRLKRLLAGTPRKTAQPDDTQLPSITLLICAYNEQDVVAEKMANTLAIDYPRDKFRIMWVTDGSTDNTNELLKAYPEVDVVFSPERRGKTAALKHGLQELRTRYVAFTDANTMINPGAMREIARLFMQDSTVGCVSGEKRVAARREGEMAAEGEGLYWRYESTLKRWDSELFSAMGAAGELYAMDPTLIREVPDTALLDDFMMSMYVVQDGKRIAYQHLRREQTQASHSRRWPAEHLVAAQSAQPAAPSAGQLPVHQPSRITLEHHSNSNDYLTDCKYVIIVASRRNILRHNACAAIIILPRRLLRLVFGALWRQE